MFIYMYLMYLLSLYGCWLWSAMRSWGWPTGIGGLWATAGLHPRWDHRDTVGWLKQEWQWMDTGSVGRAGWEDEQGELLSTWESSRNVGSCAWHGQGASGSFGVKVIGQMNTGGVVVGVCWSLPGQGKPLPDCSSPHALVLVRGWNLS